MTSYEEMEALLIAEPRARERKNKDRAIRRILIEKYPILRELDKGMLIEVLKAYATYDRAWRKTTEVHVHLRGTDYYEKFQLEDKKKVELGYPSTL